MEELPETLKAEIEALDSLDARALKRRYADIVADMPECALSSVLRATIAYRLQERHYGQSLSKEATEWLDEAADDWLPPLGKGEVADISFSSKRTNLGSEPYNYPSGIRTNEFYRYDVQVRFIGDGNGMKESMPPKEAGIKLRIAPETGYEPMRVCWAGRMSRTDYKDNFSEDRCYFFRIRTELDEFGKVKSAIYGKIYGDFKLVGKKNGIKGVSFLYYLNPTPNDRNLEWDMQHNLCPNAKDIGAPKP